MDWRAIIRAVDGEPAALDRMAQKGWLHEAAVYAALLLLEDAPHPAAATVVAGVAARGEYGAPVVMAMAPHAARALAEWRADPDWAERCIGIRYPYDLIDGIAHLTAALRNDTAALRDATVVVTRDGPADAIALCLANLGAAGWGMLDDEERDALWTIALQDRPAALGCVWTALTAAQQAETTQQAERKPILAADLIGRIGAAAWATTDAALRERLIDAAAQSPINISRCAPSWTGMSDAERARLVTTVVAENSAFVPFLLDALGRDGRMLLSDAQRDALDVCAARHDAWLTALLRIVDAGWDGVDNAVRRTFANMDSLPTWRTTGVIRMFDVARWRALPSDVQARLRASVLHDAQDLLACRPALWGDLAAGRPLPPASSVASWVIAKWRPEFVDADLNHLSAAHQALVLALTPWRAADCVPSSPRMARLLAAWDGIPSDERIDLATAHPWTLAVVAAAARLAAYEPAISDTSRRTTAAVVDTLAGMALRAGPECGTRGVIGRLLAAGARWRPEMRSFAPTDDDPPSVWDAWLRAARIGAILDRGVGLLLMAPASRRARIRARR